ncbi:MAG: 30S ribosomal protein S6 [bacterium]
MRLYEIVAIIDAKLDEEATDAVIAKYEEVLTNLGGEIVKIDKWGKRRLAYEIKKQREGFYVLYNVKAEPKAVAEVERLMKIADNILRYLVVRQDEE